MPCFETVTWSDGRVLILEQTKLPVTESYLRCRTHLEVADAIRRLDVRGAPAIGVAAAFGVALGARNLSPDLPRLEFDRRLEAIARDLAVTRPTAVNLFWALERVARVWKMHPGHSTREVAEALVEEAQCIKREDVASCVRMGKNGARFIGEGARVLTHCNAGALATAGYGTALGVIRAAWDEGRRFTVLADETRPLLQGARLTAWELHQDNIPVKVITDNMAASFMGRKLVDLVIVGADRIVANGDVANKIGTYGLAVLARHHNLPFYVAAPLSTFDVTLPTGEAIPIEERAREEVAVIGGTPFVPAGVPVANPAFDVTPHDLVTAIITEEGVLEPPFDQSIARLIAGRTDRS